MKQKFLDIVKNVYREYSLAKEVFADKLMEEQSTVEFDSAVFTRQLEDLRDIYSTFATAVGSSQQLSSKKEFYPFIKKNGLSFDIYSLLFNGVPNSDNVFLSGLTMNECMSEFRRMDALKGQGKSIGPKITEFNKLLTIDIDKIKKQYSTSEDEEDELGYLSNYFDDLLDKFEYIVNSISRKFAFLTYTNGQRSAVTHIKDVLNNSKRLVYTSDNDFEEIRSELVKLFMDSGINLRQNFSNNDAAFSSIFDQIRDQYVYFKSFVNIYTKADLKTKLLMKVINNNNDLNILLTEFKSNGKLIFSQETINKLKSNDITTVRELLSQSDFYPSPVDKNYDLPQYKQLIEKKKSKLEELKNDLKTENNERTKEKIKNKIDKLENELIEMGEKLENYVNKKKKVTPISEKVTKEIHNTDQSFLNFISGEAVDILYRNLFAGIKNFSNPFYAKIKIDTGDSIYKVFSELKQFASEYRKQVGGNSLKFKDMPADLIEKLFKVSDKINDMKQAIEENESVE